MKNTIKKQTENIKRKIVNYKVVRGIKRYIENMEFYEKNHKIFEARKKNERRANSFKERLAYSINHERAIKNVKNMENNEFEPRYI